MKRIFTALLLFSSVIQVRAQEMLGIANSNYAGTNGLSLNPSSMVDSRLNFDFNFLTVGLSFDNDYLYIPKSQLSFFGFQDIADALDHKGTGFTDEKNFDINDLSKKYNGYYSSLGRVPSAMFHIKDNYFAIQVNGRSATTISDVPAPLAKFAYEDDHFKYAPLQDKPYSYENMKIAGLSWAEVGISYGHVLMNKGADYLNGAITIKHLLGFYSGYINSSTSNFLSSTVPLCDTCYVISSTGSTIDYGASYRENDSGNDAVRGKGWGFDIGFTYQYRPESEKHYYEMDGQTLLDPEKNQYKFKVGLSILDLGKIHFTNSDVFHLSGNPVLQEYDTINADGWNETNKTLSYIYYNDSTKSLQGHEFDMALPHALSIQGDYHIAKKFYANLTWIQSIKGSNYGPNANNMLAVVPRYESRHFEFSAPISLYQYEKLRMGLALRAFCLTIGSDKIGALMGLTDLEGMDFYLSLKVPVAKKRISDKDGDHVSDKMDKCPKEKGVWETLGCPDRDGDGITDNLDSCPDVKGLAQFHGCPDTDGDGIIDKLDSCVTLAGLEKFHGCPDTDSDGIEDRQDSCVTIAGLEKFHGCPDTDGDSLEDRLDSCPLVAGPVSNRGCPVIEKPVVRTAPVKVELSKEEQEVINKVFSNLEFETGKWVIRPSSYAALDELAALLKRKLSFKLLIDGHTDNVGSAASNMRLSKNRAESVKTYLSKKEIDPSRITATGYGLTKPIASNKTPEGRQKNRRVEFTIVE